MDTARRAGTLRLYTHNIYARRAGWEARRELLQDGLARMDPDVALFQEVVLSDGYDQAADLLGSGFDIVHSAGRSAREGSGISIASRWPVTLIRDLDLTVDGPAVDEYVWSTLIAKVDAPAPIGPVIVANHFPDATVQREAERERQALVAARALESVAGAGDPPVILAGDFDAEPDASSVRFLTGRQTLDGTGVTYVRAWEVAHPGEPCRTLDPVNPLHAEQLPGWPFQQVDHIFIRCGDSGVASLHVDACELVHDNPRAGVWASDHYGLVADLHRPAGLVDVAGIHEGRVGRGASTE